MTDYENKELTGEEQAPQNETPETPAAPAPAVEAPAAETSAPQPYTTPDAASTPQLTLEPDPVPPEEPVTQAASSTEAFHMPDPPHAPEPPQPEPEPQAAPNYTAQQGQYAPPQYTAPQYTAPPYQGQPYGQPYGQPAPQANYKPLYNVPPAGYVQKSRIAAGLLALMFGMFGIHNYYLGNNTRATIQLIVSLAGGLLTCGVATMGIFVWGFVEGVLLLSGSPKYLYDGNGVILKD